MPDSARLVSLSSKYKYGTTSGYNSQNAEIIGDMYCLPMSRGAAIFIVPRTSWLPVWSKFSVSLTLSIMSKLA